jgi:hypothetical protein
LASAREAGLAGPVVAVLGPAAVGVPEERLPTQPARVLAISRPTAIRVAVHAVISVAYYTAGLVGVPAGVL